MPKLHDVVEVKFEKGKKTMSCKEFSFTNPLREVDFLKPPLLGSLGMPPKRDTSRVIPKRKKEGIISLLRATEQRKGLKF